MTSLWTHQEQAIQFVNQTVQKTSRGAGLFMGVATGKTRTAIEFMRRRNLSRVLVISVKEPCRDAWLPQLAQYAPEYEVISLLDKPIKDRAEILRQSHGKNKVVVVVNYDVIHRKPLSDMLLSFGFDLVIADEAQKLKSPNGAQSNFAVSLAYKTPYRLALTGTPLHNTPLDVFGIGRFIAPYKHQRGFGSAAFGSYNTWTKFREHFAAWYGPNNYVLLYYKNQDELAHYVGQWAFQVKREDVLTLPPVQHIIRHVELEADIKRAYDELEEEYITYLLDDSVAAKNPLVKGLRLQQITGGYVQLDNGQLTPVSHAKAAETQQILVDEIDSDQPVVIFYRFATDLNMIVAAVQESKRTYGFLNGQTHQLEDWQRGAFNTLIVQVQAGSVGVDLTRAHYAILYSLGWSLGDYDQLMGRLERTTQQFPVVYFHIVARKTVDELLYKALEEKREAVDFILDTLKR